VTNDLGAAAQGLGGLAQNASSSQTELSGSSAQVMADLFGRLGTILSSLYDQMSTPVAYSEAIEQAGDAATRFLNGLWSAYSTWTEQPAYSPLGSLVQLLQSIAEPGSDGSYVIADPQDTPYGDLTTDQGWATVEQQAKNLWLGLLMGGPDEFAGLDPLGRAALSGLVSQYDSAITTLVPVVGPATPAAARRPVRPGDSSGGSGGGTGAGPLGTAGGNGGGAPGGVPGGAPPGGHAGTANFSLVNPAGGPAAGGPVTGGAVSGGATAGPAFAPAAAGFTTVTGFTTASTAGPTALTAGPVALTAGPAAIGGSLFASPATADNGTVDTSAAATTTGGAASTDGPAIGLTAGVLVPAANGVTESVALSGPIGADTDDTAQQSTLSNATAATVFNGIIGSTAGTSAGSAETDNSTAHRNRKRAAVLPAVLRQAPVAGSSLGRSPNGSVLEQSTVPTLSSGPPSVRSGPVNTQLAPSSSGAPNVSSGTAGTSAAGQNTAGVVANASGPTGGEASGDSPMLMPPRMMGGLGAQDTERPRIAYLPEDEEYWGTSGDVPFNSIGSPNAFGSHVPDPVGAEMPGAGIGVIGGHRQADER
jgi:hypothetical protein